MDKFLMGASAALLSFAVTGPALAADAAAGEKVFRRCAACHKVDDGRNGVGPHLHAVVGRPVAAVEGYKYSNAMIEWGEGKVWDAETLGAYLENPRKVVKGTKMAFAGLRKEAQIADVIAYLETQGGGS